MSLYASGYPALTFSQLTNFAASHQLIPVAGNSGSFAVALCKFKPTCVISSIVIPRFPRALALSTYSRVISYLPILYS